MTASCHVQARGAEVPDEADRVAQRLVPTLARTTAPNIRFAVAAYLRERFGGTP